MRLGQACEGLAAGLCCTAKRKAVVQIQPVGGNLYSIAIVNGRGTTASGCPNFLGANACGSGNAGTPLLQLPSVGTAPLQAWSFTPITVACGTALTQPTLPNGVYTGAA